jgi:predicted PurR-regulated permease PerM
MRRVIIGIAGTRTEDDDVAVQRITTTDQQPVNTGSTVRVLLTIITVVLVVGALWLAQVLLIPLMLAVLITCGLEPLHRVFVRRGIPRGASAAVLLIAVVLGLSAAGWALHTQAATFVNRLPVLTQRLRDAMRDGRGALGSTMQPVQQAANELKKAADESAPPPAKGVTRVQVEQPPIRVGDVVWRGTMGALGTLGQASMVLFLIYYLLSSGDRYKEKLLKLAGPSKVRKHLTLEILNGITEQIERFLVARVVISTMVGVATTLALSALGVSQPVMWGLVAGVLNNVPYLGPITAVGAIALASLVQFGTAGMAAAAGGAAALIALFEGFAITPWMMGRAGRMNTGVVFLSLMFWGWIWGVWGMLFAIPIMMAVKAVCDHIDALESFGEVLGE